MTLNSMQKNGLLLGLFALVSTALVLGVEAVTEDAIAEQQRTQTLASLNEIIPPELHDNDLYHSCGLLSDNALSEQPVPIYRGYLNGKPSALAAEAVAPNGYSGKIRLLVAIKPDGEVLGVRTLQHQETPGLGDKIEKQKSDWIRSFAGKRLTGEDDERWAVQRDGGMFDQFTGATITPRAVVGAVKSATWYLQQNSTQLFQDSLPQCNSASQGESHE